MKISSVRYLVNQGLKSIWTNRMMSFASFCILLVSLLMVGVSVLTSVNLNRMISGVGDKSEVVVIIRDNVSEAERTKLESQIKKLSNVSSITFYSKESAWESMMADMADTEKSLFQYANDNPLPDTFRLTVVDIAKMGETTTQIDTFKNVEGTKSPTVFADILISIRQIVTIVSAAIILALILVCMIIISNTTRTSVFARRKEINIMKYVGATNSFIRIPFFVEGMVVGLLAAGGALLLTKFAYEGVYAIFSSDFSLLSIFGVKSLYSFNDIFLPITIAYAIAGAVIGAIGTSISAGKHLKV